MLPKWHFLLSILFIALVWIIISEISLLYLFLIFFGAFFIDFDHYAVSVWKTGKIGLFDSFKYHDKMKETEEKEKARGIRRRGDFHLFHTVEYLILVFVLDYLWVGFFYIFIGMLFHSVLDLVWLVYEDRVYRREFFLINWLRKKI